MRRTLASTLLLLLAACQPSDACHRRRACRCHHARVAMVASAPIVYAQGYYAQATYAPTPSPQATQIVAEPAEPAAAVDPGVQPAYAYRVEAGQPAYYYTYDDSGKLVIAQWMDWIFGGGRAAGEPRPPLPIVGPLLGNR